MPTPNDPIDPIPDVIANNDTLAMPVFPRLARITRNESVGVVASNKQERSLERRTDTLAEKVNALIETHNINATDNTSVFLKRAGGTDNAMQGELHLVAATVAAGAPRADQTLTSLGLNTANLNANNKRVGGVADGVYPGDAVNLGQLDSRLVTNISRQLVLTRTAASGSGVEVIGSGPVAGLYEINLPLGTRFLLAILVGGGGGGGGGGEAPSDHGGGGAGGAAGEAVWAMIPVYEAGRTLTVLVGSGGAFGLGGPAGNNPGQAGTGGTATVITRVVDSRVLATAAGGPPGAGGDAYAAGSESPGGIYPPPSVYDFSTLVNAYQHSIYRDDASGGNGGVGAHRNPGAAGLCPVRSLYGEGNGGGGGLGISGGGANGVAGKNGIVLLVWG